MAGGESRQPSGLADVVNATYKTLLRAPDKLVSKEGLTRAQFHALRCAAEGPLSMKAMSEKMSVTKADITGLVGKLETKGLVRRESNRQDKRETMIELTPKGAAVQKRVGSRYRAFVQESLGVLTAEEQASLGRVLRKLQEGMSRAGK